MTHILQRTRLLAPLLLATCTALTALPALAEQKAAQPAAGSEPLAFPGALGWAAHTPGGRAGVDIRVHDVIIQHIRVRTGTAGMSKRTGWEPDAMGTIGAYNVVVDHCSMTWSIDENLSA